MSNHKTNPQDHYPCRNPQDPNYPFKKMGVCQIEFHKSFLNSKRN